MRPAVIFELCDDTSTDDFKVTVIGDVTDVTIHWESIEDDLDEATATFQRVIEILDSLPSNDPVRPTVAAIVDRLSIIVGELEYKDDDWNNNKEDDDEDDEDPPSMTMGHLFA